MSDSDKHYRDHFDRTYGDSGEAWEEVAPAYGYGSQAAEHARYAGRHWDEIEPELRSEWDSRQDAAAPSTWEKMKAAIRHGWDRITSGDSGLTY